MTLRRLFTSLFLLLGLLCSPAMASEDSAKNPAPPGSDIKSSAASTQSEEERENDIWKNEKKDTIDAGKLFGKIIKHLEDTYELHFISVKIPLPVIFTD